MSIEIGKLRDENDLNTDEARIIYTSDGQMHRIVMPKIGWRSFDILLNCDYWTEQDIADRIQQWAIEDETPLEAYFINGVSYMHRKLNEATQEYLASQES
jgi:hypothetical protein